MPKKSSPTRCRAYFIGIGGIGISALARWFLAQNWAVSGSDLVDSEILKDLRNAGVKVKIGHKKANLPSKGLDMVIYSAAIPFDNQELIEARRRGIKPLSYSEVVGCLTKVYKTVAVSGSHGKSTTTAMISLVLIKAGFNPNVIIGTTLKEFRGTNFHKGRGGGRGWLVLEADEWKASFLNYHPEISVVTNIDKEHLDFYKNFANIKKTFLKFLKNTKIGGTLILNRDDKILWSLHSPISQIAKRKSLRVIWYQVSGVKYQVLKKVLKVPGEHNVSNAMAALAVAGILKIKKGTALKALGSYQGAWRRMEYKGSIVLSRKYKVLSKRKKSNRNNGFILNTKYLIPVYDDYAHHPTEIKATLQAFRDKFPQSPMVCVYQPHQVKRLKALFKEFVSAFNLADILILIPVYEVAGRDKVNSSFTSQKLVTAIRKKYPNKEVYYLPYPKKIKEELLKVLKPKTYHLPPTVVMMGAGDIVNYTSLLLRDL